MLYHLDMQQLKKPHLVLIWGAYMIWFDSFIMVCSVHVFFLNFIYNR